MLIAKKKRKENIAEYIIYLWQLEDLLRALKFDSDAIYTTLVAPQEIDDSEKQVVFFWYIDIVNLLTSEGKRERGHLEHTLHLISDLNDLHLRLLTLPVGVKYAEQFRTVEPELEALRKSMGDPSISDVELCFRALYSVILLRIKEGDDAENSHIKDVMDVISPLIASLSKMYRDVESGEIDLFKGADGEM